MYLFQEKQKEAGRPFAMTGSVSNAGQARLGVGRIGLGLPQGVAGTQPSEPLAANWQVH